MKKTYFAHYDLNRPERAQLLLDHLRNVSNRINVPCCVSFDFLSNPEVVSLCRAVGIFHDLGKYTDYFQEYLVEGKSSSLKNHAHLSACLLFLYLSNNLSDFNPQKNIKTVSCFIAYLAVRLHHSSLGLQGISPGSSDKAKLIREEILTQAQNIKAKYPLIKGEANEIGVNLYECLENIHRIFEDKLFFHIPSAIMSGRFSKGTDIWFFLLVYLFSTLIDADKLDSSGVEAVEGGAIQPEIINEYIQAKHGGHLRRDRFTGNKDKARKTMTMTIEALDDQQIKTQRFFTITAPTGIGKTLAALDCALRLRNRIKMVEGYVPRIISAIPFINVIEQTRVDYENLLQDRGILIVHHSLADFTKGRAEKEDNPEISALDRALLEVESWEGDVILTTFVQFFHSLLTGSNRALKKVNKLAGSIVILDEVQAIPGKYMPLIGALLIKLGQYFGTRFILMTATQPKILKFGERLLNSPEVERTELLPDHAEYFCELKRTKFVPILEAKNTKEFVDFFMEVWPNDQAALIVVNTINRSIEIFKKLIDKQKTGKISSTVNIRYLSTNIVPCHRKKLIMEIKEKLTVREPVILVSTQTIEAGVDLDFDLGFRDLAPLESLVQTAGRVNREGKKGEFLPVYIMQLKESTKTDCQAVYKLHNLERTKKLLVDKLAQCEEGFIGEPEYRELVAEYYCRELEAGIAEESKTIWDEGIKKADFEVINKFQLIERIGEVVDVFVEMDEKATTIADAYETVKGLIEYHGDSGSGQSSIEKITGVRVDLNTLSRFELKALLKLVKAKMNEYVIQLRANRAVNNKPMRLNDRSQGRIHSDIYWIPRENIGQYYDEDTGFIDEGQALIY